MPISSELVAGFGGTIIGYLLNEISAYFKRKEDVKERFVMANYSYRQQANASLYTALSKYRNYFIPFLNPGNEYLVYSDPDDFAPLGHMDELRERFDVADIWLTEETRRDMAEIFDQSIIGCNIAIAIASQKIQIQEGSLDPEDAYDYHNNVISFCSDMVKRIDGVYESLRKRTAMDLLDEYQNRHTSAKSSVWKRLLNRSNKIMSDKK